MDHTKEPFNPFDPAGIFKDMRDVSMDAWAKTMVELVHTDAYAESTARMLDAWLSTSTPLRKAIEKSMTQALAAANMPSLDDVTRLSERLTNIEMRLDDMDAKLDAMASRASENHPQE